MDCAQLPASCADAGRHTNTLCHGSEVGRARRVVRTVNLDGVDGRFGVDLVRPRKAGNRRTRLEHTLVERRLLDERRRDQARARFCRESDFEVGVGRARGPLRPGHASSRSAECKFLDAGPVQPDFEAPRLTDSADEVAAGSLQDDLDDVLAVRGEMVANGETAARPERQVFTGAILLQVQQRHAVLRNAWTDRGIARRQGERCGPPRQDNDPEDPARQRERRRCCRIRIPNRRQANRCADRC